MLTEPLEEIMGWQGRDHPALGTLKYFLSSVPPGGLRGRCRLAVGSMASVGLILLHVSSLVLSFLRAWDSFLPNFTAQ